MRATTRRFRSDAPLLEVFAFVESDDDVASIARWKLARADVQPPRPLAREDSERTLASLGLHSRVLVLVLDEDA